MRQAPAIDLAAQGGFQIDGVWRQGPVLIIGELITSWSGKASVAGLDAVFQAGVQQCELLILGLGLGWAPPSPALKAACRAANLGLEALGTVEAVRLYNLLARDGRYLAAALNPI